MPGSAGPLPPWRDQAPSLTAASVGVPEALVEAIARRFVELLAPTAPGIGLVDAATWAAHLGVTRGWVYRHADALGAVRLGDGRRARMRFHLERACTSPDRSPQHDQ